MNLYLGLPNTLQKWLGVHEYLSPPCNNVITLCRLCIIAPVNPFQMNILVPLSSGATQLHLGPLHG